MSTLNNTQVKPLLILQKTPKFWWITGIIVAYTFLTSLVTYGIIIESFSIPRGCMVTPLNKPKMAQNDTQMDELVEKVKIIYKVPLAKAERIVNLASVHTMPGKFPSPQLMIAIAKIESNFDENAVSSAGAKGTFQVMDKNQTGSDAFSNAYDSVQLLKEYYSQLNGNLKLTLMAYNMGITKVLSGKAKNHKYAEDVKKELDKLKSS